MEGVVNVEWHGQDYLYPVAYPELGSRGGQNIFDTRGVHKISFPLVPQLVNHLLCEATACI